MVRHPLRNRLYWVMVSLAGYIFIQKHSNYILLGAFFKNTG